MTENPNRTSSDRTDSARETAQHQAQQVKSDARHAAKDVAGTAREEAGNVKDEAVDQAKGLVSSAKEQASSQVATQQQRLAQQSRTVTEDLRRLSRGEKPESDMVTRALSSVADRAEHFTTQLENKEPADLLQDVRRFAARRPGAFLAIAAGVGLVAGRLTRGLKDHSDGGNTRSTDLQRPVSDVQRPPAPPAYAPAPTRVDRVPGTAYPEGGAGITVPEARA